MRGRKPLPAALRELKGNPGQRPVAEHPEPPPELPECPDWLDPVAKTEWDRVAPALVDLRLLTRVDRTALAAYCQLYARWQAAEKQLAETGLVTTGSKGQETAHPLTTYVGRCVEQLKTYCVELGFTPSSRCRIDVPKKLAKADDPLAEFLD